MSNIATARQQLKIKSGVVSRLFKEQQSYQKEAEQQKLKLDKLKAENAEEWDVKNATRIYEESQRMIKDSSTRLEKAVGELRDLVISAKAIPELEGDEHLLKAEGVLETASV